jgi:hypothetical protein
MFGLGREGVVGEPFMCSSLGLDPLRLVFW